MVPISGVTIRYPNVSYPTSIPIQYSAFHRVLDDPSKSFILLHNLPQFLQKALDETLLFRGSLGRDFGLYGLRFVCGLFDGRGGGLLYYGLGRGFLADRFVGFPTVLLAVISCYYKKIRINNRTVTATFAV